MASRIGLSETARSTAGSNSLLSLVLALAAGLLTWSFIHWQDPSGDGSGLFRVDEKYHIRGLGESDQRWAAYLEQQGRVDLKNAGLVIGILGASLGAALAMCGPRRFSVFRRVPIGIFFGAIAGVLAGISGSLLQQSFNKSGPISVDLSAYINALLFGTLGLGLGAVVGGLSGSARTVLERSLTGLFVGVLAGIAYPTIAYVLFANVNIEAFIPKVTSARLLWLGVGTGMLGLMIPWGLGKQGSHDSQFAEVRAPTAS